MLQGVEIKLTFVQWDLPQTVVDWAQVLGAALGLVAIVVALFALWRQRRDAMIERKAQYELDLLRDLVRLIGDPHGYREADVLMSLFSRDLPNLQPVNDALKAIGRARANHPEGEPRDDAKLQRIWSERRPDMLTGIKDATDWRLFHEGRRWSTWR
ncbi:hypothetical protein AB0I34_22970 [Kribbella sp. NPDC050281]|uniref:hypothetical protein n=1 Tax=Kribbella sp. NPDC050281 TaxID=3155515 RepID=UPI0034000D03